MHRSLIAILFPAQPRRFAGERWVNIGLRSVHLVGVAGIGGGFLFDLDPLLWENYWRLTVYSGLTMVSIYLWTSCEWLLVLKGLAIIVKLLLLGVALLFPELRGPLFGLVILISGISAHAPAWLRGTRWLNIRGLDNTGHTRG